MKILKIIILFFILIVFISGGIYWFNLRKENKNIVASQKVPKGNLMDTKKAFSDLFDSIISAVDYLDFTEDDAKFIRWFRTSDIGKVTWSVKEELDEYKSSNFNIDKKLKKEFYDIFLKSFEHMSYLWLYNKDWSEYDNKPDIEKRKFQKWLDKIDDIKLTSEVKNNEKKLLSLYKEITGNEFKLEDE